MIAQIPILLTDAPGIMVYGEGFEGVSFPAEKRALDFSPKDQRMNRYWTPFEVDVSEAESRLLPFLQSGVLKGSDLTSVSTSVLS